MKVELEPGVADLLWRMGEQALTVELTLDFEGDVLKQAVAFPGASDPSLGFQRVRVGDVDVWWRQRFVFATREPEVTQAVRPRHLVVSRVGRALSAVASYAPVNRRGATDRRDEPVCGAGRHGGRGDDG